METITINPSPFEAKENAPPPEKNERRSTVGNPDTSAALDFTNQLRSAQLLLQIETGDTNFRITRMREYLAKNY